MLNKILMSCFLVLCTVCTQISAKSLALSFDDGLDPSLNPDAQQINHDILKALKQNQVQAILYPSLSKIGGNQGLSLVAEWGQHGHRIANHGNLHLNLNKNEVSLDAYLHDIQQGHEAFSTLDGFVARYRFPFLKEGNTLEKRDGVRRWIKDHHYQSGAVSIDASDWYYNQLFLKFQQNNDANSLKKLKQAYISHLLDRAKYYDGLAIETLGRSPKHILLLHVRAINAAWLKDVIAAFQDSGWQFIDSDSAYQDPLYTIEPQALPAGESILWNIAKNYGVPNLRYPAEDAGYEYAHLKKMGLDIQLQ
ncbi:polysaccharide deacetylase [Acinetobacter sp. TGL-Y2]|uniref:polysaccharide deacetylase family protein n=1 Tax=Acinetobacter sp. TGL-Y2 TaxID=1407071 RepID=UPI0007A64CC1|nr:polysaccharide deacetylase family protein [Acinetobacter sp. TGL-Y2]AMW77491.1 polysaccharide deacetylase [Acinetobacter sp. TGL-Y2]